MLPPSNVSLSGFADAPRVIPDEGRESVRPCSIICAALKLQRHEDAEGVFRVALERAAVLEAERLVEAARGVERLGRARLKAQAFVAPASRLFEYVPKERARHAAAQVLRGRAHGLYLRVRRVELFERAAAQKLARLAHGPEGYPGPAQAFEVERVDALGRRVQVHVSEVLAQKLVDLRARQVVNFYLHEGCRSL